jgi:hypothetical protein
MSHAHEDVLGLPVRLESESVLGVSQAQASRRSKGKASGTVLTCVASSIRAIM